MSMVRKLGLELDLTEASLFPSKIYYLTFLLFTVIGTDLVIRHSPWGWFMYFWAIWAAGLGWNKQEEERADLITPG